MNALLPWNRVPTRPTVDAAQVEAEPGRQWLEAAQQLPVLQQQLLGETMLKTKVSPFWVPVYIGEERIAHTKWEGRE